MRLFISNMPTFPIITLLFIFLLPVYCQSDQSFFDYGKLTRLEESWSGQFGNAIDSDGNTLVVGGRMWKKTENCCSCGSVFVYYRETTGSAAWKKVKKVVASDCSSSSSNSVYGFGEKVAISGDTLVVGSYSSTTAAVHAIYIYERNQGGADNWGQIKKITVPIDFSLAFDGNTIIAGGTSAAYVFERDYGGPENWGQIKEIVIAGSSGSYSTALMGDTAVIGCFGSNDAHIFERNEGGADNWGEVRQIVPADGMGSDRFGWATAINGDLIAIGAPNADGIGENSGAVYLFGRDVGGSNNWGQIKKVAQNPATADDYFGSQVSLSGGMLMATSSGTSMVSKAYIFYRNEGGTDQWGQITDLTDRLPTASSFDQLSIHITEESAFLGIRDEDIKGHKMGIAFVFERDEGGADQWGETQMLYPEDDLYVTGDHFGISISCSSDSIAVGAYQDDESGSNSGAVYVFEWNLFDDNLWGQYRKVTSVYATTASGDFFGSSLGIDDGLLVVGAYLDDDLGSNAGAAYIFERTDEGSDGWGYDQGAKMLPSDGAASDYFGYSVAVSNDTVVVGAYQDDDAGTNSGAAYVFQRDHGGLDNWGQVVKIVPSDGAAYDYFGYKVAISGDTIAVGAYQDDDNGVNSGSVYLYSRNEGGSDNWGQIRKIGAPDGAASDYFGQTLSLDSDALLVAAQGDDDNGSNSGSAYLFSRDQGGENSWGLIKKLTASDGAASDSFGSAVQIMNDFISVGAQLDDDMGASSGAVYLYQIDEGGVNNWGEVQKITAPDGAAGDSFGAAVSSIYDAFIVIGSTNDDDFGLDSGSVYIWAHGVDSDKDGLMDSLEESGCTQPDDADSDDDGILDGEEDVNHNGSTDPGETNPCIIDTDSDGLLDGTELGLTAGHPDGHTNPAVFIADLDPTTTTNPLVQDTDGDGILDGAEDANGNGSWDLGETAADVASGDYNLNNAADLTDLILVLQTLTQIAPSGSFELSADTDGDHQASLADALYIFQSIKTP